MDARWATDGTQIGMAYALLALASGGYALLLQTRRGRLIAARRTWVTVVAGVLLVLAVLLLILDPLDVLIVAGAFCAAGTPMVWRSLHNELHEENEARQELER